MNKRTIIIIIIIILLIAAAVVLFITSRQPAKTVPLTIATIWDAPESKEIKGQLDFDSAGRRVQLGRSGFEKGLKDSIGDLKIEEIMIPEEPSLREMIMNVVNIFTEKEILMTIGATTDEASMDASMEMNYFNVPMLIPYSDGMISPDKTATDYSMRMQPTVALYDDYVDRIFTKDLFTFVRETLFTSGSAPEIDINIAVFFVDNFNGNNSAVSVTQSVMDAGYNIDAYIPFTDLKTSVDNGWSDIPDKFTNIDAVIIIGEDANPFPELSAVWHSWTDRGLFPDFFLIGYLPDDTLSEDLKQAGNVFVIQPKIDMSNCPAGITSRSEALGYASGLITGKALSNAVQTQPAESAGIQLWFMSAEKRQDVHSDFISSFRSNVRSALMDLSGDIPCYGEVAFKNGPDDRIKLELVHYTGVDQFDVMDENAFTLRMIDRIKTAYGLD